MRTIGSLLSRLGLRVQIGILAGIGIAGLGTVTGFFIYYDHVTVAALEDVTRANTIYEKVQEFERSLLLARKAESGFLATRKQDETTAHSTAMLSAISALQDIQGECDDGGGAALTDIASHIADFRAVANSYTDSFATVVELTEEVGSDENTGLQGKLRRSVHEAEALLDAVDDLRARVWMLTLRRNEKDFLLRLSPTYRDAFEANFGKFGAALQAAGLDPDHTAAITAKMADYRSDFLRLVPKELELAQQAGSASDVFADLETRLQGWEDQVLALRDTAVEAMAATRTRLRTLAIAVTSGALLCVLLFAGLIGFGLTRALRLIADAMGRLARDDRDFDLTRLRGRAEIGRMAASLEVFRTTADTAARLRDDAEEARQAAELDKRQSLVAMVETIERQTNSAMATVSSMTAGMSDTAQTMAVSAGRTTEFADQAATEAERALRTAQTVASAAEELSVSVKEITRQVTQSADISRHAVTGVQGARGVVEKLVAQAKLIGQFSGLITSIARRTNLLALNATIEAARAGEAGRGFAVVAGEVKSLASQTARATEDIARELSAVTVATEGAVQAMQQIEATIAEVDMIGSSIAAAVEQQGAATAEIARSVGETAAAAQLVSARILAVRHEAADTGHHTSEVHRASAALHEAMLDLKASVIHSLRTSTVEVDRRRDRRVPVDRPCRIAGEDGEAIDAVLVDLSLGGARVGGVSPGQLVGEPGGKIHLEFDGQSLAATIIAHDEADQLRVKFIDDEAMPATLSGLLDRLSGHLPAAA